MLETKDLILDKGKIEDWKADFISPAQSGFWGAWSPEIYLFLLGGEHSIQQAGRIGRT